MVDYSQRKKILKQLNSELQSRRAGILDLGVTGSKVPSLKSAQDLKPSKIPRPSTPSRPLPPPGYVSETLTAHRPAPHTYTPTLHSTGNGRRQLTVVIHGLPQSDRSEDALNASENTATHKNTRSSKIQRKTHDTQPNTKKLTGQTGGAAKEKRISSGPSKSGRKAGKAGESRKRRLGELRGRYLVRKFGRVWIRKVFGKVHPSSAREHYAHSLARRVFQVWHGEWWSTRREWKLKIRAECHDRYRLWQLVWSAWTLYTVTSRESRKLKDLADTFSSLRISRMVWSGWCEYVGVKRRKRGMKRQAEQWRATRLVRCVWVRWREGVEDVRRRRSMETAALHHWAHRLTEQVWQHWLVRLHTRQVLTLHEEVAQRHYNQTILFSTWAGWRDYVQVRHDKKALKSLADNVHCSKLLHRVFEGWRGRFERAQEIAEFQELIAERGQVAVKRRRFHQWRLYISFCWYKTHLLELSAQFKHFFSKKRAFSRLRLYSLQKQREAADKQLACQHQTHKLLCHCWKVWLHGCEHREEIKMGPQTRAAQHHFAIVINRKIMAAWVQYTLHRRERKRLRKLADEQFKTYALPRCLRALRENVEMELYKRELGETAEGFRTETLLSMVFYKWWREAQLSQDLRMLERVAILHDEEVKKRNLLKFWRAQTRERVGHLAQEAAAVIHYRHRKMGVAFQKWHIRLEELVARKQQLHQASNHCDARLMSVVLSAWKRYIVMRRHSSERRRFARAHFTRVITHKLLLAWKAYLSLCQDKRAKQSTAEAHLSKVLKKRVFGWWVEFTAESKTKKQLVSMATLHHHTVTLKKCLCVWLQRTAESIDSRQRENELVSECGHLLTRARLSRILHQWRDFSVSSLAAQLATERAYAHHTAVLRRKCFNVWWGYHRRRLRKSLLTRQGEWFLRNRLLSVCYTQWRVQFMHALVVKQKSVTALWYWSQSLQRRCLAGWLLHTLEKKRKKERYSQALDRHRRRLVTVGVTQWIKVATEMQAQREAIALQHQTQTAQAVLGCVRRCASHWLALTRRRKLRPPHRTHPTRVESQSRLRVEPHNRLYTDRPTGDGRGLESQGAGDWGSLLKSLKLPDGSRKDRPQPRRPHLSPLPHTTHTPQLHTTHPHTEAQPRRPLVPPPHQHTQLPQHSSFTFLTSTCSESSQLEVTSHSRDTRTVETPLLDHCVNQNAKEHSSSRAHSVPTQAKKSADSHMTASLQTSSNPCLNRVAIHHTRHKRSSVDPPLACDSTCSGGETPERDRLPPTLTDPSVQQELVQMRDALKHFHQLKARRKMLASSLSSLTEEGNSEELHEARQELSSLSHTITSNEPLIKQCALRLNQLLTQAGLKS